MCTTLGMKSKRKGYRLEHELETILKNAGLNAKRVPLSGATQFQKGDIIVEGLVGESKGRGDGFKNIYKWLGDNDLLFIRADNKDWLAVVPMDLLIELLLLLKEKQKGG